MRKLSGLSSKKAKQAIQYNVNLSVTIPLDKLQSARAILRILQIYIAVAREDCSYLTDEVVVWSHHHLSFSAQHPSPRVHHVT